MRPKILSSFIILILLFINITIACEEWNQCKTSEDKQTYLLNKDSFGENDLARARESLKERWNENLAKKYLVHQKDNFKAGSEDNKIANKFFSDTNNVNNNKDVFEKFTDSEGITITLEGDVRHYSSDGTIIAKYTNINIKKFKDIYKFRVDKEGELYLIDKYGKSHLVRGKIEQDKNGYIKGDNIDIDDIRITGEGIYFEEDNEEGTSYVHAQSATEFNGVKVKEPTQFVFDGRTIYASDATISEIPSGTIIAGENLILPQNNQLVGGMIEWHSENHIELFDHTQFITANKEQINPVSNNVHLYLNDPNFNPDEHKDENYVYSLEGKKFDIHTIDETDKGNENQIEVRILDGHELFHTFKRKYDKKEIVKYYSLISGEEVHLSDEQKNEIEKIRIDMEGKINKIDEEINEKKDNVFSQFQKLKSKEEEYRRLNEELDSLKKEEKSKIEEAEKRAREIEDMIEEKRKNGVEEVLYPELEEEASELIVSASIDIPEEFESRKKELEYQINKLQIQRDKKELNFLSEKLNNLYRLKKIQNQMLSEKLKEFQVREEKKIEIINKDDYSLVGDKKDNLLLNLKDGAEISTDTRGKGSKYYEDKKEDSWKDFLIKQKEIGKIPDREFWEKNIYKGYIPEMQISPSKNGIINIENGRFIWEIDENSISVNPKVTFEKGSAFKRGDYKQIASGLEGMKRTQYQSVPVVMRVYPDSNNEEKIIIDSGNHIKDGRIKINTLNYPISELISENEFQTPEDFMVKYDINVILKETGEATPNIIQIADKWFSKNKKAREWISELYIQNEFNAFAGDYSSSLFSMFLSDEMKYRRIMGLGEVLFDPYTYEKEDKIRKVDNLYNVMDHEFDHVYDHWLVQQEEIIENNIITKNFREKFLIERGYPPDKGVPFEIFDEYFEKLKIYQDSIKKRGFKKHNEIVMDLVTSNFVEMVDSEKFRKILEKIDSQKDVLDKKKTGEVDELDSEGDYYLRMKYIINKMLDKENLNSLPEFKYDKDMIDKGMKYYILKSESGKVDGHILVNAVNNFFKSTSKMLEKTEEKSERYKIEKDTINIIEKQEKRFREIEEKHRIGDLSKSDYEEEKKLFEDFKKGIPSNIDQIKKNIQNYEKDLELKNEIDKGVLLIKDLGFPADYSLQDYTHGSGRSSSLNYKFFSTDKFGLWEVTSTFYEGPEEKEKMLRSEKEKLEKAGKPPEKGIAFTLLNNEKDTEKIDKHVFKETIEKVYPGYCDQNPDMCELCSGYRYKCCKDHGSSPNCKDSASVVG